MQSVVYSCTLVISAVALTVVFQWLDYIYVASPLGNHGFLHVALTYQGICSCSIRTVNYCRQMRIIQGAAKSSLLRFLQFFSAVAWNFKAKFTYPVSHLHCDKLLCVHGVTKHVGKISLRNSKRLLAKLRNVF